MAAVGKKPVNGSATSMFQGNLVVIMKMVMRRVTTAREESRSGCFEIQVKLLVPNNLHRLLHPGHF